jgi:hypothetical protein
MRSTYVRIHRSLLAVVVRASVFGARHRLQAGSLDAPRADVAEGETGES